MVHVGVGRLQPGWSYLLEHLFISQGYRDERAICAGKWMGPSRCALKPACVARCRQAFGPFRQRSPLPACQL